jgi:hypothetical protein
MSILDPKIVSIANKVPEPFEASLSFYNGDPLIKARSHAARSLALLSCISQGELLAGIPRDPADASRHKNAVTLLDIMEGELRAIMTCLDGIGVGEG